MTQNSLNRGKKQAVLKFPSEVRNIQVPLISGYFSLLYFNRNFIILRVHYAWSNKFVEFCIVHCNLHLFFSQYIRWQYFVNCTYTNISILSEYLPIYFSRKIKNKFDVNLKKRKKKEKRKRVAKDNEHSFLRAVRKEYIIPTYNFN